MYQVFRSPERDRLAGEISDALIELDRQIQRDAPVVLTEPWARAAYRLLLQADGYLAAWNLQQGWVALHSAQRAVLTNPNDRDSIVQAAIVLRREAEAERITGWRLKAVKDLICEPIDELEPKRVIGVPPLRKDLEPKRVIDALRLRDDQFDTRYFKILLRRYHLRWVFLLLLLGIAFCLLLSFFEILPDPFTDAKRVAAVILFGALGAVVSVSLGLLSADASATIPAQQVGSSVVWMRPAIGATLALVALIILYANEKFKIIGWDTTHIGVILAFAFAAGFSERFVVGAIERISESADSS